MTMFQVNQPFTLIDLLCTFVSNVSLFPLQVLHVNAAHVPRRPLNTLVSPYSSSSRLSNIPSRSSNTGITYKRRWEIQIVNAANKCKKKLLKLG